LNPNGITKYKKFSKMKVRFQSFENFFFL